MSFNGRKQHKVIHKLDEKIEGMEKRQRFEFLFVGLLIVIGIVLFNLFSHLTKDIDWLSFNFNPKVGPMDVVLFLIGLRWIWKGLKK